MWCRSDRPMIPPRRSGCCPTKTRRIALNSSSINYCPLAITRFCSYPSSARHIRRTRSWSDCAASSPSSSCKSAKMESNSYFQSWIRFSHWVCPIYKRWFPPSQTPDGCSRSSLAPTPKCSRSVSSISTMPGNVPWSLPYTSRQRTHRALQGQAVVVSLAWLSDLCGAVYANVSRAPLPQ